MPTEPNETVQVKAVRCMRRPTHTVWGEASREWVALDGGGLPYVLLDEIERLCQRIKELEALNAMLQGVNRELTRDLHDVLGPEPEERDDRDPLTGYDGVDEAARHAPR